MFKGSACHKYVCSNGRDIFPWVHYYSTSLSFSKEAGELCESCTIIIVRQHGPLGSGTVIWACLAASNHEIHEITSCDEIPSSAGIRAQHFDEHALLGQCSLISNLVTPHGMQSSRVSLLLYELELLNGSRVALRVMYYHHCAPARTPGHLSGHLGLPKGL